MSDESHLRPADEIRPADAVKAMRARGVDDAEAFLDCATPEVILATCQWWDRQSNAKKGLLVWKLRQGGVEDQPAQRSSQGTEERLRAVFAEYAGRLQRDEHGEVLPRQAIESHARLQKRRGQARSDGCEHDTPPGNAACSHDDPCLGRMVAISAYFPVISAECSHCGLLYGYPVSGLHVLPNRTIPASQEVAP